MCRVGGKQCRCPESQAQKIRESARKEELYQAKKDGYTDREEWVKDNPIKARAIKENTKERMEQAGIPFLEQLNRSHRRPLAEQSVHIEDIQEHYNEHIETLPSVHKNTLALYTGTGYKFINAPLRDGRINDDGTLNIEKVESLEQDYLRREEQGQLRPYEERESRRGTERTVERVKNMDAIFEEHAYHFKPGDKVYRYIEIENPNDSVKEWIRKNASDGIYNDKAYVSTSMNPEHVIAMAEVKRLKSGTYKHVKKRFAILEIEPKRGVPIAPYYANRNLNSRSIQEAEEEILLERNSKFEIEGIDTLEHSFDEDKNYPETAFSQVWLHGPAYRMPIIKMRQV